MKKLLTNDKTGLIGDKKDLKKREKAFNVNLIFNTPKYLSLTGFFKISNHLVMTIIVLVNICFASMYQSRYSLEKNNFERSQISTILYISSLLIVCHLAKNYYNEHQELKYLNQNMSDKIEVLRGESGNT